MIQLTLTLKTSTAQVVESSVTVNNNSPIQDYCSPGRSKSTYLCKVLLRLDRRVLGFFNFFHIVFWIWITKRWFSFVHKCDVNVMFFHAESSSLDVLKFSRIVIYKSKFQRVDCNFINYGELCCDSPTLWVTETTRIKNCWCNLSIWPIRGYSRFSNDVTKNSN